MIGRAVTEHFLQRGYNVRAMVHRASPFSADAHLQVFRGDMTDPAFVRSAVSGTDFIVHLAARKSDEADSVAVNEGGARILLQAATAAHVRRIINISTQSVKLSKHGLYAASKAAADHVLASGSVPVTTLRLSVAYGDLRSGILGTLLSFAKLPIVPVIGSGKASFRPIHHQDIALAIERLLRNPEAAGKIYDAGGPDIWSFDELLRECGRRIGRPRLFLLHLPTPVAMLIARMLSGLRRPPITVSNVLGSEAVVEMDTAEFFHDIGFRPRTLCEGLDLFFLAAGDRETSEATALLRHVLPFASATFPGEETVARYRRALLVHNVGQHALDERVLHSSVLLGSLDAAVSVFCPRCVLRQKLLIASAIAECTPESAAAFLPRDRSFFGIVGTLALIMLGAGSKLLIGLLLAFFPSFFCRNAGC